MTERELLIELLDKAILAADDNFGMPNSTQVADYLLANGVVVPVRCGECVECYNEGNFGADGYCSEGKRSKDNG